MSAETLVKPRTYSAKPLEVERQWWVVDAKGQTLGRLATRVANILRGKNKPQYTPNVDTGDFVIVVNAEEVKVSGNKFTDKLYRHHSGFPGGYKETTFRALQEKHPERIIEKAVAGMLPHNRLGAQQIKKLSVYKGSEHPHQAQKPQELEL